MKYDPIPYWKEAGKTYYQNFTHSPEFKKQETELLKYLKTLEFNSVLELGCGFGRITRLISENFKLRKYSAIDISPEQLEIAKKTCPNVDFVYYDINHIWTYKSYDLVIAVEVLMHMLPKQIHHVIDRMYKLSGRHVINVDFYSEEPITLEPHNFNHDYPILYFTVSKTRVKRKQIGNQNQSIFHLEKTL